MAATRQATWRRAAEGARVRPRPHTSARSHFLPLMNSHELFITHTRTQAQASRRAHTQLLSATEGSATSLYFIIISLGIFLGCKGIPGGARPLKLSTPPPSSFPFPPHCTLSLSLSESLSSSLSLLFSLSHCFFPLLSESGSPPSLARVSGVHYKSIRRDEGKGGGKQTRRRQL